MSDAELLDEFSDALWLEDGLSRNTLESYRRDLNKFADWLAKQRGCGLLAATHADIQGFLAHLVSGQKAKATSYFARHLQPQALVSLPVAPEQDHCRSDPADRHPQTAAQSAQESHRG